MEQLAFSQIWAQITIICFRLEKYNIHHLSHTIWWEGYSVILRERKTLWV